MKTPLFTGVCTALVTPFQDEQVNYSMLEQLLQRQLDAGIEAIVISGTSGEAPTLSDDEKLTLFRWAKEYVGDACKIVAGTGSNCTAHTVTLSKAAEECGVDGLLVVTPYYNKANETGLIAHYEAVADAVDLPIILYNVPTRTGMDISVNAYRHLSALPNIAGVKEASPDITKIGRIRRSCGFNLPIWTGNDEQTVPVMAMGGLGVISVVSNVRPAETQAMAKAAQNGDFTTASAIQLQLQPLVDALFSDVNPIPVKEAMRLIGYDCGPCRLPLGPMDAVKQAKLIQLLQ